jgi:hypothetical protein
MIERLQLISFEVTDKCNLAEKHSFCPSKNMFRSGSPCSNQEFLDFLYYCTQHGFKGNVGYIFYNEPTLDLDRCKFLNDRVHTLGLKSTMWTNGTCKEDLSMFDEVYVTQYNGDEDKGTKAIKYNPDSRIKIYNTDMIEETKYLPCYRPMVIELPIDYNGNIHLCCADWRGDIKIGNIKDGNFKELLFAWAECCQCAEKGYFDICLRCEGLERSPALLDPDYKV